jgi:hypothetical protein
VPSDRRLLAEQRTSATVARGSRTRRDAALQAAATPMPPLCRQCQDATLEAIEAMGGSATRTEIRRWAIAHGDIDHKAPPGHVEHHLWWSLGWLRKQGEVVPERFGRWARSR